MKDFGWFRYFYKNLSVRTLETFLFHGYYFWIFSRAVPWKSSTLSSTNYPSFREYSNILAENIFQLIFRISWLFASSTYIHFSQLLDFSSSLFLSPKYFFFLYWNFRFLSFPPHLSAIFFFRLQFQFTFLYCSTFEIFSISKCTYSIIYQAIHVLRSPTTDFYVRSHWGLSSIWFLCSARAMR